MIIRRKAARVFPAVLFVAATNLAAPAFAADALGTWYTADRESQVKIVNCGGALCGTLVWLKQPNDPATGRPKTDKNNADASKQGRPLIGVPIVLGMRPSGTPNQWSGEVYNASDGKTYSGTFTLTGANTADLKGCVLSILCKSQTWTRANYWQARTRLTNLGHALRAQPVARTFWIVPVKKTAPWTNHDADLSFWRILPTHRGPRRDG